MLEWLRGGFERAYNQHPDARLHATVNDRLFSDFITSIAGSDHSGRLRRDPYTPYNVY